MNNNVYPNLNCVKKKKKKPLPTFIHQASKNIYDYIFDKY